MGAGYKPELDQVLWSSDKKEFKPKATIRAQIKSYNGGEPKVMLVEEGKGYSGKTYSGAVLKRVGSEDLELVFSLLKEAQPELDKLIEKFSKKRG